MPPHSLRLLALDGGGVRGLSSLMILERLMEAIDPDNPPKPCDYFDMIGGTSTGGLIAIMLGRLKMTIDECITAFLAFSDHIFQKKAHRLSYDGKLKARFDTSALESSIKDIIIQKGFQENDLLKDAIDASCKVFVCAMSKETQSTICLTSYRAPGGNNDLLNSVKIWEACRATSAATTFFDPIVIGRYGEEFVDGATGANNPTQQLWNQAERLWGADGSIDAKIQCIFSLGTGSRGLKPFRDDVLGIAKSLQELATECTKTAEIFQQSKPQLDRSGRYFRFDVSHGLEDIGLEESKKRKEIASATRHYMMTGDISTKIQRFSSGPAPAHDQTQLYNLGFSLHRVPVVNKFIERPVEMDKIERALLPSTSNTRRKIFVLRGMGGIGKTQLTVEFARCHHHSFSTVFWIDGSSIDKLQQSFRAQLNRIPGESSGATDSSEDFSVVKKKFLSWLSQSDNNRWLLIFDNVDRDWTSSAQDPLAFDLKEYFPDPDHGSILITTRLVRLEQFGSSLKVGTVDRATARAILELRSQQPYEDADVASLLEKLNGLPLAIAQAGAYLAETGISIPKYLELYEASWEELSGLVGTGSSLEDYPNRNVGTTWAISFKAIQREDEHAANLLLLWSHLDNKDLWFGLLNQPSRALGFDTQLLIGLGDIAAKETVFLAAMRLLQKYSLVESTTKADSYTTHVVVHQWAYSYHGGQEKLDLEFLACVMIGLFLSPAERQSISSVAVRALPHTQSLVDRIRSVQPEDSSLPTLFEMNPFGLQSALWEALSCITLAYRVLGKLKLARELLSSLMVLSTTTLGSNHIMTSHTANQLGLVYMLEGNMDASEKTLTQALDRSEAVSDGKATEIQLENMSLLAGVYTSQGKYAQAEDLQIKALLETDNPKFAARPLLGLAGIHLRLGKLERAEEEALEAVNILWRICGEGNMEVAGALALLGDVYTTQKKYSEAEETLVKAVDLYEAHYFPERPELDLGFLTTLQVLGECYFRNGNMHDKAREVLTRARDGYLMRETDASTLESLGTITTRLAIIDAVASAKTDLEFTEQASPQLLEAEMAVLASPESSEATTKNGSHQEAKGTSRWRRFKQKILK